MLAEPKTGQAYHHMERGQSLEQQGRLDEAMLEFKQAIEADPSIPSAHVALGQHYRRKGLLTKAADEFHTAALLSSDYSSHFELGQTLSALDRYGEAERAFRQCLSIEPYEPSARYELASVLYAQGAFGEALQQLKTLVGTYPDDLELSTALAECHLALSEHAAAEAILTTALEQADPDEDTSELYEALWVARRHLEFAPHENLMAKDMLYAEQGIVCLGTRRDDGIDIPVYQDHAFTYSDVAVTCRRLAILQRHFDWSLGAVAAIDDSALPLSLALAQRLDLPVCSLKDIGDNSTRTLVVLAAVTRPEVWEITQERISAPIVSFALALTWRPDEGPLPDLVGIMCRGNCALPWQQRRTPSPETAALSILRACAAQPEEENVAAQIAYYRRDHPLLRFSHTLLDASHGHGAQG